MAGFGLAQEVVLPPPPAAPAGGEKLSTKVTVLVRAFRFEGNTVFSDEELEEVVAAFTGRELTSEELEEARAALTRHYIDAGYINSGAILPDQTVAGGTITFQIVEGVLGEIRIEGEKWLREGFIRRRIERGAGPPLNVLKLKDALEILRQNQNVERFSAELKPGAVPGESRLDVAVEEAVPYQLGLRFSNKFSPSIGAERFELIGSHSNLTGNSDLLAVEYGINTGGLEDPRWSGLDNITAVYSVPVTAADTTVGARYRRSDNLVTEDPFEDLDIESDSNDFALDFRQPVFRTPRHEVALLLSAEHRRNKTFLLGEPFSLFPGAEDGRSIVSLLRFSQEWLYHTSARALAARSTFTFGFDVLEATSGEEPDGQFVAWLGILQFAERLFETENQFVCRLVSQLTDDSLLALEQLAIGGFDTVRGYRENRLVRDNGVILSGEFRIPILYNSFGKGILDLAPFVDFGYGRNVAGPVREEHIGSAGIGLLFHPNRHLNFQFYYGYPFRKFDEEDEDLQDLGIHFDAIVFAF
jgi:hemolysin activation/secretion protein